jgi:hypothetical protein
VIGCHVARIGKRKRVKRFGGETWGKEQLRRPRRRRDDNIKMDLQEVGCGSTDWIKLALDRVRWWALENVVIKLQVP